MKRIFVLRAFLLVATLLATALTGSFLYQGGTREHEYKATGKSDVFGLYERLNLPGRGLNAQAYHFAVAGWQKLKADGKIQKDILAICDFSQRSNNNRLYIIDLKKGLLLYHTLVAHGKNTGGAFARYFSNEHASNKSSLGFFSTENTYTGKHGLSLVLNGLEPGINDHARERAIVMHGADYVAKEFGATHGRIGRSLGCPAIPAALTENIVETLKNGSCLFIYYPDKMYLKMSRII